MAFLDVAACARGPAITLHSSRGPVNVRIEIADTPETRARGLMYRRDLGADAGMLFVFPDESERSFWMKNTPLPLDMVFIGADRTIVGIVADTRPFTTNPLGVGKPSKYVLEVHGGFCAAHAIVAGNQVELVRVPSASQ